MAEKMHINYQARTREEFGQLEDAMKLFFDNFGMAKSCELNVRFLGIDPHKFVEITPDGYGTIDEVVRDSSAKGFMGKATPEEVSARIGNTLYLVRYKPKKG